MGGPSSPPASERAGNPGDVSVLAQKRGALCRSKHWCSQDRRGRQPLRSTATSVCRKMLGLSFPPSAHLLRLSFSPVQRWVEGGEARGSVGVTAVLVLALRLDMGVLWGTEGALLELACPLGLCVCAERRGPKKLGPGCASLWVGETALK